MAEITPDEARALRDALAWRRRYEDLDDAIGELFLWEPGRKGWAAALHLFKLRRQAIDEGRRLEFNELDGPASGQIRRG